MAKTVKVPKFVPKKQPAASSAKVVMTVRLAPKTRDALQLLYRNKPGYNSVSHIIQIAVDQFLAKRK